MRLLYISFKFLANIVKRNFIIFLFKKKLKNLEKYRKIVNLLKNYSNEHKKFVEFLRNTIDNPNVQLQRKKLKIFNYYEKRQRELKSSLKFLRKTKKGRELYQTLVALLGIHQRERDFMKKLLNAFKRKDEEMTKYYLFVIEDLLRKDEKALEKFMDSIENFIKERIN
ncbi:MAG: hypothetical protein ABDH37_06750 [Candidatus Hydrothermales bacterium]